MKSGSKLFCILVLCGIVWGCTSPEAAQSFENQVETMVASTISVPTNSPILPTATFTPIPTRSALPNTEVAFPGMEIHTVVDNVNLRTNPGLLFKVSRVLPAGTQLQLIGQAPGAEWLNVLSDEGINGWVSRFVVDLPASVLDLPLIEPTDVYVLSGYVQTELNTPVSGIGFAFIQGSRRNDAKTDETGHFFAYFPQTLSGMWEVGYISVSCTSNTMDSACQCIGGRCGKAYPELIQTQLQQTELLEFIWK